MTMGGTVVRDGYFRSLADLPAPAATARVRHLSRRGNRKLFIVLAATGEAGYAMRHRIWAPLLRDGVDLLFLENPFYGPRARPEQRGPSLLTVSDLLLLVKSAVSETAGLVAWGRAQGYDTVALGGYSMGAYVSLLAAAKIPGPLQLFPLSVGIAPAPVFTDGILAKLVHWPALSEGQYVQGVAEARVRLGEVLTIGDLRRGATLGLEKSIHILAFERDAFIARKDTEELARFIPHAEVRYIPDHGHVSAVIYGPQVLLPFVRDRI
jgi:pimeloyl-ACP methyl ester carboxylesterase